MVQKSTWKRFVTKLFRILFWNINSRTYPFKLVSYPIVYVVICPQALTCFKVKGLFISENAIDDIRIPRRPWDQRLHSMIARLKRGTFWQKHKQTLISRG